MLLKGNVSVDDRGSVKFVNDFDPQALGVKRLYMVENHRVGFIRAWHGHLNEAKYVLVVSGAALIGAVKLSAPDALGSISRYTLFSDVPSVLHIPAGYANGFMTLQPETRVMFFSTSSLEESRNDDIRFPFDKWDIWNIEQR
jgi:dTDP-4-dehydrorhamnose 3,5-epimerase-like enzyme